MSHFITPKLRNKFDWFQDDDWSWEFCSDELKKLWEIPRGSVCWIEVDSEPIRGSYVLRLKFGPDYFGDEDLFCEIQGKAIELCKTNPLLDAARKLGVKKRWKGSTFGCGYDRNENQTEKRKCHDLGRANDSPVGGDAGLAQTNQSGVVRSWNLQTGRISS